MSIQGVSAFPVFPQHTYGVGRASSVAAPAVAAPAQQASPVATFELTAEERAYFAKIAELGQVTYGPRSQPAVAAPLGQRIDVRA